MTLPRQEMPMIDLCTAATPNGRISLLMLEETGAGYELHKVSLNEIADLAVCPWAILMPESAWRGRQGLSAWLRRMADRPAVLQAMTTPLS